MLKLHEEFRKVPVLKVLIPLLTGIIAGYTYTFNTYYIGCSLALLFFCLVFLFISGRKKYRYSDYVWSTLLIVAMLHFGIAITLCRINTTNTYTQALASDTFLLKIREIPIEKDTYTTVGAEVQCFRLHGKWVNADFNVQVKFVSKRNNFLSPGQLLVATSALKQAPLPVAPYQFNYRQYLFYRGYCALMTVSENQFVLIASDHADFLTRIEKLRQRLLATIEKYHFHKDEKAVISSLLLGYTGYLDNDLKYAYAATGTMHILSVSGLHVGIVFLFLSRLLFFLDTSKKLKLLKTVLVIAGIWFYSLISGFSSPVIRSSTMFTLFAIAGSMGRNNNSFNTLSISALLTLLVNPFNLFDVGFQLSYTAMVGIFLFFNFFNNIFSSRFKLVSDIWALISVSIAAQLGTLALSVYYFNQFSNYFIISNVIIVPFSGLVLYLGIVLLFVSPVPFLAGIFSTALNGVLMGLNGLVRFFETLPFALLKNISLNLLSAILLMVLVLIVAYWMYSKNGKSLILALFALFLLMLSNTLHDVACISQRKFVVYNIRNTFLFSYIKDNEMFTNSYSNSGYELDKQISKLTCALHIKTCTTFDTCSNNIHYQCVRLSETDKLLCISGLKIIITDKTEVLERLVTSSLQPDYILYSGNLEMLKKVVNGFNGRTQIIVNSKYNDRYAKDKTEQLHNSHVYFLNLQGAFIADL